MKEVAFKAGEDIRYGALFALRDDGVYEKRAGEESIGIALRDIRKGELLMKWDYMKTGRWWTRERSTGE